MSLFQGRKLVIATNHGKEQVISPALQKLGMLPVLSNALDTDSLGTFTGEVERTLDPVEAARQKCRMVVQMTGCDMAIASEGSFGPHPLYGFIPCDEELLVFADFRNDIEVIQRELSLNTNHDGKTVATADELLAFADKAKFPSHALILRYYDAEGKQQFIKGLKEEGALKRAFDFIKSVSSDIRVETDMRAMNNPTRMQVIGSCAEKLGAKIATHCPGCSSPGFGITSAIPGLPCNLCGLPTRSTLALIHSCGKCGHTTEEKYPRGKTTEEPVYCDFCNP